MNTDSEHDVINANVDCTFTLGDNLDKNVNPRYKHVDMHYTFFITMLFVI